MKIVSRGWISVCVVEKKKYGCVDRVMERGMEKLATEEEEPNDNLALSIWGFTEV